ncbi:MAG: DUF4834 family protein [Muribaculaceae bacterium]|nr:DUF4834 family protein [Muribaculaceae bacterium]
MGTFILVLLILGFLFWPLIRTALALRAAQKRARQAFTQAQKAAEEATRRNRPGGWSRQDPTGASRRSARHKKKIDPTVGEYVEWEEIKVESTTTTSTTDSRDTYVTEEQIVDAEWEDIRTDRR